jgi:DNA-binding phage protein
MNETLQDPIEAIGYLEIAFAEYQVDGDTDLLLRAIQRVYHARNYQPDIIDIQKMIESHSDISFNTLSKILNTLGYTLTIKTA